jgi:hypothetical protein
MRRAILFGAGLAASLVAGSAAEARGYYYNRPGVARETYMADVAECIELAGGVRPGAAPYVPPAQNIYAAGASAFFAGMFRSAERRRMRGMVERTCMADKGYARYEVNDAVLDEIENLRTQEERLDRLFGLAASSAPVGTRTRE